MYSLSTIVRSVIACWQLSGWSIAPAPSSNNIYHRFFCAVFNRVSKVTRDFLWFCFNALNESEVKLKRVVTCSLAFSCAA